jgi:hypothetical protein
MNNSVETFRNWFWVSLVMFLFYSWLLYFKVHKRGVWLRYTAAESTLWSRLGLPRRFTDAARRFGESKASTVCLWIIVILFALLMALNACAYIHFKHRLVEKRSQTVAPQGGVWTR